MIYDSKKSSISEPRVAEFIFEKINCIQLINVGANLNELQLSRWKS